MVGAGKTLGEKFYLIRAVLLKCEDTQKEVG